MTATINERKQARWVGYEQRYQPDAGIEHLDLELAASLLRRTPAGERPVHEALEYYALIDKDAGDWRITNAALLLFARRPARRWHEAAGIRVFRAEGNERLHGRERNATRIGHIDPPLGRAIEEGWWMVRRAAGWATSRIPSSAHAPTCPDIPHVAGIPATVWREALVNAIAHRDYEVETRETEIWLYDDRVEISNPGDLLRPATLDALRRGRPVHASRKPLLVRVLTDAGIMRDEGSGIPTIFHQMKTNSLPLPVIILKDGVFRLTLYGQYSPRAQSSHKAAPDSGCLEF
ncbi:ATP-binding protein [Candidatus Palauibacter sp.]|uniref:ATP-binding protein n=1 Tax=Candidatus Palauibacter sp. TaxID=3101350 RepID=UPI003C6FCBFF